MKKWLRITFSLFFIFMLFFFLFYKVGVRNIISVFLNMKLVWLIPFFVIFFVTKIISTINILIIIRALKKDVKFWKLFKYIMVSFAIGKYFPSKVGEVSLAWLLKKNEKFELGEGLAISLIDKLTTLIILASLAAYGLIFVFKLHKIYLLVIGLVVIGSILLVILISSEKARDIIKRFILRKYSKYFKAFGKSFIFILTKRPGYVIANFLITAIQLLITIIAGFFVFKALGIYVNPLHIIVIDGIVAMIQFLPLPYSGLGVKEVTGSYLFSLLGVPLSLSANYMIFNAIFKDIIFFFFYFLWEKHL